MGNGIGNSFGAARPSVLASDRERRYFRRRLAVVGSSARISFGSQASAMAMTMRCFMPPEN